MGLTLRPEGIDQLYGPIDEQLAAFRAHEVALGDRAVATAPHGAGSRQVRSRSGQLLGRRMIEAGARSVTVLWDCPDGYGWDSHTGSHDLGKYLLPGLDQTLSALLEDMGARGLLDETLVVCLGEMGRTPRPATAQWGRGHWCFCFPALLAGAGIRGGMTYGRSDKDAAYPVDDPVSPENLAATVFHALGITPASRVLDPLRRPVPIMEGGQPLAELFG